MDKRMDEWTDWMNGYIGGWTDRSVGLCIVAWMDIMCVDTTNITT